MTTAKTKFGRIYKKYRKLDDGTRIDQTTWTVRYKGVDHATGETDIRKAQKFLMNVVVEEAKRADGPAAMRKPLMNQVLDLAVSDAKRKGNRTARQKEGQLLLHQRPFFGLMRADKLTSSDFESYIDQRLDESAAPGTINVELGLLKRALNLAVQRDPPMLVRFPKIHKLKEDNVRKGFLQHAEYVTLKNVLPDYLVPLLVTGYHVGCRRGELTQLELRDIDMTASQPQFRLYPDVTKNGEGRVVPIYGAEMTRLFQERIARTKREFPGCTWFFHNEGERILTFYKAWETATDLAKVAGLLFHDLRRNAVRNLIRSGVTRREAMKITGHKTEDTFERYNIIDEADMSRAADKAATFYDTLNAQPSGASTLVS